MKKLIVKKATTTTKRHKRVASPKVLMILAAILLAALGLETVYLYQATRDTSEVRDELISFNSTAALLVA